MRIIFILSVLGLFQACGDNQSDSDKAPKTATQYPLIHDQPPASYQLADEACQKSQSNTSLTETTLTLLEPIEKKFPKISDYTQMLRNVFSDSSVRHNIVSKTTFGEQYEMNCDDESLEQKRKCLSSMNRLKLTSEQKHLKVCKDKFNYPRRSYERIALQNLHAIDTAYTQFAKIMGNTRAVASVELTIMPQMRITVEGVPDKNGDLVKKEFFQVSNLIYFPPTSLAGNTLGVIAVLPERQESATNENAGLWESPFAAAHEFGHHLQRSFEENRLDHLGLTWNARTHQYMATTASISEGARRFITAISEAFADLTAFYAFGENAQMIESLTCFGFNRSPRQPLFFDGSSKIFSNGVLWTFNANQAPAQQRKNTLETCSKPNIAEPHDFGAILTYQLNTLFHLAATEPDDAYRLTLSWYEHLIARFEKKQVKDQTESILENALSSAEESVLKLYKDRQKEFDGSTWCKKVLEGFPALDNRKSLLKGQGC